MGRRRLKKDSKSIGINISINERILEKTDDFINDPHNLNFGGNRSKFIAWCILKFFEEQEKTEVQTK